MKQTQFHLMRSRRFLPLFVTQFLGAFNDNLFKNALVVLVTYQTAIASGMNVQVLVTLAAGLFILPFFLFSAIAGQLADKLEKSFLIRLIKMCEVALMILAAIGYLAESLGLLMTVLFLMGTQSTFFGPLKYGILPDHLRENELIGGNALIEAGTFLAILFGTIVGSQLVLAEGGVAWISAIVITLALVGWAGSWFIPRSAPAAPDLRINPNFLAETVAILRHAAGERDVFLSILGISWFWLVGAIFLAQFPTYTKDVLGADEDVLTVFLTTFSLGIGLGSLLCNQALKGEINAKFVPLGAFGMAIFSADLVLASLGVAPAADGALVDLMSFLSTPQTWRILLDLVLLAICGGFYIVPLYAILQTRTDEQHRARTIAANNIMNAIFIVVAMGAATAMLAMSFSVTQVFLVVAIGNVVVAVYICRLLPGELVKALGRRLFRLAYRVEVKGLENYKRAGERVVIVVNHTSFLDAALLCAFLPETPTFAINSFVARRWWVQPAFHLFDLLPLDPTNPMAAKTMVRVVKEGRKLLIFPEGRITVTGALMKVYEGPGTIADLADAQVLPIRIDGAQYTSFSRLKGKVHRRWFPKISITILAPRRFQVPEGLKGRARRQVIGNQLYDLMADMIFQTEDANRSLFGVLVAARRVHGGRTLVLEDVERKPMSYNGLIRSSLALGQTFSRLAGPGEHVGVLLPNSVAVVIVFMALQAFGRVPAMLNFSTGTANMVSACRAARITAVVTSRRFIALAKLEDAAEALSEEVELIYLDDRDAQPGIFAKLFGLLAGPFAGWVHLRLAREAVADAPAVVLFTSGSEGTPKGVVLSHRNLLANCAQLSARIDFSPQDRVFNVLPVFHSFGLTGGLLLPLLSGIQIFLYPSPLHYRIVPELIYDRNATILFGTDTFLAGYARAAHPYDFYSLRYVFAGAERLREETRRIWAEKFGLRLLDGYGATETGPVLSCNTPMHFKVGTVGRLLPGIRHRLEPVPGVAEGGRLQVQGVNIMLGYLRAERPGELEPPTDGWYDTGDIVSFDDDGYITILGRAKRFAKVAGEMVSLTAVEEQVAALWPEHNHAVVAVEDSRKGEQLVLVTENPAAERGALQAHIQAGGGSELMIPRHVVPVESIPLLGTGKTDYVAVQALAVPAES